MKCLRLIKSNIEVPRARFEPATTRSSAGCSPRLSYLGTGTKLTEHGYMCVFKVSEKHFTTYNEKKEKEKMFGCLLLTTVCYACKILNCDDV